MKAKDNQNALEEYGRFLGWHGTTAFTTGEMRLDEHRITHLIPKQFHDHIVFVDRANTFPQDIYRVYINIDGIKLYVRISENVDNTTNFAREIDIDEVLCNGVGFSDISTAYGFALHEKFQNENS